MRAFLGMGSNLGDRRQTLRDAVAAIDEVTGVSPVYETEPVGGPEQGAFYNIVVELETERSPQQLLALCRELEQAANRVRVVRWGPRTLDVDVLLVGDLTVNDDDLTVPHARMTDRNFVMVPLLTLAPDLADAMTAAGYDPATAIGDVVNIGPL
jgi:2-amino-4-hydroxy-6-hydroxymethyldihydropteridine diphosphokinase